MSEVKCSCCQEHDHEHHEENHNSISEKQLLFISSFFYIVLLVVDNFSKSFIIEPMFLLLYFVVGYQVIKTAIISIFRGQFFNEFTLMFLATATAIIIKQMPEAVGVMLFYRIGEFLQESAAHKSRKSIKELITSKPDTAHLIEGDIIKYIRVEDIKIGQKFLVKSGDKIPTDSVVVEGSSKIDNSSLTGEFMPVSIYQGMEVLGGSINIGNVITVEAIKEFRDTSIAKTLEIVEHSSKHKDPTEKFVSKFAKFYTPIVFFIAIMVAIIPPLLMDMNWNTWIYRALVMLVISCPCALVVSIPLSYFAAIGTASKKGILIKGGAVIDAAKNVSMVVFDKTGTLTKGELSISLLVPYDGITDDNLLETAAYVEQFSNHPIANAVVKSYGKEIKVDKKAEICEVSGKGLVVKIGKDIYLGGNIMLLKDYGVNISENKEIGTKVYFAVNKNYKGCIVLNDEIRKESFSLISHLKNKKIETFMLTGDNYEAADYVASKLGIGKYKANLLPQEKVDELNKLSKNDKIIFVGDGINDAPILSCADVGVSMGEKGAKIAVEVSDAVILNDNVEKVADLIGLSKKTEKIVWQNITMALGIKILFMALGVVGLSGLWEAVFADVGVSLLAVFNSLRILRK